MMLTAHTLIMLISSNFSPLLTTIGFGGLAGFLIGFIIKKLTKILAIIAGIFLAALTYLGAQGIVNINWDKLQSISEGVLSTVVNTATTGGVGGSPASLSSSLSPTTTNLGIPLTGSAALGFAIWIMKG